MIIDQVIVSTCTDATNFISDENFANMLLSNVTVNVPKISNSDTRYENIKTQKIKQVDYQNLGQALEH